MSEPNALRLTREQSREIDRIAIEQYGLPGIVLMENAGRGAAELLLGRGVAGPVVICCGKGNNAGDGFVIARHLAIRGCVVSLLLFAPREGIAGDAAINLRVVERMDLPRRIVSDETDWVYARDELAKADWVVDALLGTGTQGAVREPFLSAIRAINSARSRVLAVDLPSGLDCDSGETLGECVRATVTATFVAKKTGFDSPAAQPCLGEIEVISIGAPSQIAASLAAGHP